MFSHTDRGDYMYYKLFGTTFQNGILKPRGHNALGVLPRLSVNNTQLFS